MAEEAELLFLGIFATHVTSEEVAVWKVHAPRPWRSNVMSIGPHQAPPGGKSVELVLGILQSKVTMVVVDWVLPELLSSSHVIVPPVFHLGT